MKVIVKVEKYTINRGVQMFTISKNDKGGYFAHELGQLTQWANVFNTGEQKAHRLNNTRRWANQYTRTWIAKPFKTIAEALQRIEDQAKTNVQYF